MFDRHFVVVVESGCYYFIKNKAWYDGDDGDEYARPATPEETAWMTAAYNQVYRKS